MRRAFVWSAAALMGVAMVGPVVANGPYLEPVVFGTNREFVTIQAAHGAEVAFQAMGPMRTLGDFFATDPDGVTTNIGAGTAFKGMSIIEPALTKEGTWKIGTGERAGRTQRSVLIDGVWRSIRDPNAPPRPPAPAGQGAPGGPPGRPQPIEEKDIPAGAQVAQSVSYLRAETYVTRGAPSEAALKPTGKGFELAPITHPNEVYAGEAFNFTLLNDGQGVGGVKFEIRRAGDVYRDAMFALDGVTGADGKASVTLKEPGRYILESSYPGPAQPGGPPRPKSTNYSLTFEVTR